MSGSPFEIVEETATCASMGEAVLAIAGGPTLMRFSCEYAPNNDPSGK